MREAEARGWVATARVERAPICVWQTVIDVSDEVDASVIVCGTRGRNAAKHALLAVSSKPCYITATAPR